jgi:hypothetical protein
MACEFLRFLEGIDKFAFWDDLRNVMALDGLQLETVISECRYRTILDYLLTSRGLNYGSLPKGLLKFHRYPDGCRTAFEEHLVEATGTRRDVDVYICGLREMVEQVRDIAAEMGLERRRVIYERYD